MELIDVFESNIYIKSKYITYVFITYDHTSL